MGGEVAAKVEIALQSGRVPDMANYFQARKAAKVFTEYRRLTIKYWEAQPDDHRSWMSHDSPAPENDESVAIRKQIIHLYPEADVCASWLGVDVTCPSFPAPAVGGPVLSVDLLYAVVDRDQGHSRIPKQRVLDFIDLCLARSIAAKKTLLRHQLINPIWWTIEIIAYILRIPFVILRKAGVPANVEESIWGHIIKILVFVTMILIALHYGLKLSAKDVLNWIK